MSKCEVSVSIENGRRDYVVGETVRGIVHVEVDQECPCEGLIVGPRWRTHGRGHRARGGQKPQVLFQGKWLPGTYEYPFELTLPRGPLTYRGHYLDVIWYVFARAEVPWSVDPKGGADIILSRGDYEGRLSPGDLTIVEPVDHLAARAQTELGTFVVLFCGLLLLLGASAAWRGIMLVMHGANGGFIFFVLGVFVAAGGWLALSRVRRSRVVEKVLGKIEVTAEPASVRPGDVVRCRVRLHPPTAVDVAAVTVRLLRRERVVSGTSDDRRVETHDAPEVQIELLRDRRLTAAEVVSLDTELQVPDDAAPSFLARSNRVEWVVGVQVRLADGQEWSAETEEALVVC